MKRTMILLAVAVSLLLAGSVLAMSSGNYRLDWYVVLTGGGGGPTESTHYATNFTVGQTAIGAANSTTYGAWMGYWYGTGFTLYVCSDGYCGGNIPCHETVSEAVQVAITGTLIKIAAETQNGSFSLNADKSLMLQGGWDASFNNPNGGTTTLEGAPKAPQGSLKLQELRIVP